MKKVTHATLTLIILYGITFFLILAISLLFDVELLFSLLGFEIIATVFAVLLIFSNRRYEVKVIWACIIILVPLVGLTTYLFLGKKYIIKKDVLQYHEKINDKMLASFHEMGLVQQNENNQYFAYLKATFGFGAVTQNEICIFQHSTMSYQSVIADLQKAQSFILINYYIVEEGELFDTIFAILKAKLQANVKVYLIIDHGGSIYKLKTKVLYELKSQGLEYALYFPVNYSVLFGNCPYRNHRKDIIIDGKIGYTGASNISDLYLSFSAHFGYWQDQLVKITGVSVQYLMGVFLKDWSVVKGTNDQVLQVLERLYDEQNKINFRRITTNETDGKKTQLAIIEQRPYFAFSYHEDLLATYIDLAKKTIAIMTPYFIPTEKIMTAFKNAQKRGVKIHLIIPGKTDKIFLLDISRYFASLLFQNEIMIFETNNYFLHSKIYFFDEKIIVMGTTNLDKRSFYMDEQTLLVIANAEACETIKEMFRWTYDHSSLWMHNLFQAKPWFYQIMLKMTLFLTPIL